MKCLHQVTSAAIKWGVFNGTLDIVKVTLCSMEHQSHRNESKRSQSRRSISSGQNEAI